MAERTSSVRHPLFARIYRRVASAAEAKGAAEHRGELLAGLSGRVVEVGAGHGLNFAHYPTAVAEVVAVEPEPYLRTVAEQTARTAAVPVTVLAGTADRLPVDDESVDAGVASLVLCSVPDQVTALAELFRVIKPGGELRFYEHVVSGDARFARWQRRADHVWPLFSGGCHTSRDTVAAIEAAGFEVESCREFPFRPCLTAVFTTPHVSDVGGTGVLARPGPLGLAVADEHDLAHGARHARPSRSSRASASAGPQLPAG